MVYWWGRYPYLKIEQIQTSEVEIMNTAYDLSGSFGSIVRSKFIVNNTYTYKK